MTSAPRKFSWLRAAIGRQRGEQTTARRVARQHREDHLGALLRDALGSGRDER